MTEVRVTRKFIPGSEWLTYKLYMGTKTADDFLRLHLIEIIERLTDNIISGGWFFIRYMDPDFHLRIRLRSKGASELGQIIHIFYQAIQPWVDTRLIYKVSLDTYSRELERYGEETIMESEELFNINSHQTIKVLNLIENEEQRWLLAAKSIDVLLNAFNLSLLEKRNLLEVLKDSFGREFGTDKHIRKQLSRKFNNKKEVISEILEYNLSHPLNEFSYDYEKIYERIQSKQYLNNDVNLMNLLNSYLHMLCNRIFISRHRMNEWVLYDLLYQFYRSSYARQRNLRKERINSLV